MSLNTNAFTTKLNEICRTCLKGGQLLTNLFDEENNINLVKKLKTCTALQFDKNDDMPNKICPTCIEELLQAYNFINKCQINEATLRKYILNQNGGKVQDVPEKPNDLETSIVKAEIPDDTVIYDDIDEATFKEEHLDISDMCIKEELMCSVNLIGFAENSKKRKREKSMDCDKSLKSATTVLNSTFSAPESVYVVPTRETRSEIGKENFLKIKKKKIPNSVIRRKRRKFNCPVCPEQLLNSMRLLTHFQTHTETKNTDDKEEVRRSNIHLTEQITKQNVSYRCQICWKKFNEPEQLLDHYKQHIATNKCEYCFKIFTLSELRKHLEKHTGSNSHTCQLCGKKVANTDALEAHKLQHHCPNKTEKCRICSYTFDVFDELKTHENEHISGGPFNCRSCRKKFDDAHNLIAHKVGRKCGKFYKCHDCSEVFQLLKYRKMHELKHN